MTFRIVVLDRGLDRSGFSCGEPLLDRYFRQQVFQDMKRLVSNCFVALRDEAVAGFYTLACASIPVRELPEEVARRLPRYPVLPAIRIGRLAVDERFQGQGIGAILLADALGRALKADAAGFALLVEAKNDHAAHFYRHHGFLPLASCPGTLFLPLATAAKAFAWGNKP